MENFEILKKYPRKNGKVGGMGELFGEKILLNYKHSKIQDPFVLSPVVFDDIERVKNFKVHADDVFLCGFPRSGTTFMQEMIWLISHDFDFKKAAEVDTYNRAQWFDFFTSFYKMQGVDADHMEKLERPRVLKTHYPVQLLPPQVWTKNAKIIFISRDVKDVAVSYYYTRKKVLLDGPELIDEHYKDFLCDQVFYAPYKSYLKNFSALKDKENVLILTYEESVGNKEKTIRKVAKFLNKEVSDENLKKLTEHLDFKAMRKNPMTNMKHWFVEFNKLAGRNEDTDNFIRRGKIGSYKDEMSEEYAKKFDEWMNEV